MSDFIVVCWTSPNPNVLCAGLGNVKWHGEPPSPECEILPGLPKATTRTSHSLVPTGAGILIDAFKGITVFMSGQTFDGLCEATRR
jgi:hypothetical protein